VPEIARPVNRAALVERYIELLLRKSSLTEILKGQFDFHNKVHFLAWIAGQMVLQSKWAMETKDFEDKTKEYVRKFELDIPVEKWRDQFLDARILTYGNGLYSFKYRVFFEYFVAQAMKNDGSVKSYVLDEQNYLGKV
jgi:hypothetical protein